jgi:hypothetical protein
MGVLRPPLHTPRSQAGIDTASELAWGFLFTFVAQRVSKRPGHFLCPFGADEKFSIMETSTSTTAKIKSLLRESSTLNVTRLSALFTVCGLTKGLSDASINRALQLGKFPRDVDDVVKPVVLALENLVAMARPYQIAFEDPEHVKLLLDILGDGGELSVSIKLNSSAQQ